MTIDLHKLPAWPQSQESLANQISDLIMVANRLGLHDAADAVKQIVGRLGEVKYGCYLEVEQDEQPDGCVIDEGKHWECNHAKEGMRKEQCKYWRIITPPTEGTP
jgi:hypothetical protein